MVFDVFNMSWLLKNLNSNEFLIAGIFGAVAYIARTVPFRIYEFMKKALTIEFVLTNEDTLFQDILNYVETIHISWLNRSYSKNNNYNPSPNIWEKSPTEGKINTSNLTVGYGRSWFIYRGRLCTVHRSFKDSNHSNQLKEEIRIVMFTRNKSILIDFIDEVSRKSKDDSFIEVYTPSSYGDWQREIKIHKRSMDSVYIDDTTKHNLIKRIDDFLVDRQKFYDRGIPYKLGIMISGKPGTGKTSLIKALASKYSRDIYLVNKNVLKESPEIGHIDFSKSVLVFEDIDSFSVVKNRTDKNEGDDDGKMSMSMLLQILDGALTPDGLIVFATTNDITSIDPAVTRKGRFDDSIVINELSYDTFVNMCSRLWDVDPNIVRNDIPRKKYINHLVGAQLQDFYLVNNNYKTAVGELREKISGSGTTP